MKSFVVLLAAAYLVACVHGYPGSLSSSKSLFSSSSEESDEKRNVDTVLVLPPGSRRQFGRPSIDISDLSNEDDSFESFLPPSYFQNIGTRFRSRIDELLQNMRSFTERFHEWLADIPSRMPDRDVVPWRKIPEGANTTSTTKIIDGHVVTINETTYMDGDDETGTLIRVRVIDVKPMNETILLTESEADAEVTTVPTSVTEQESTTQSRSVETVEDIDNEIPKAQVDLLTA